MLFVISILVNIGMWLERFVIIVGSLSHDFMPHNWHSYAPTWIEVSITVGSFAWFLFLFFGFAKSVPTVSISDVKEDLSEGSKRYIELDAGRVHAAGTGKTTSGVMAVYEHQESLMDALRKVRGSTFKAFEIFSPVRLREAEVIMGRGPSPVRLWTLIGALTGLTCGFWLAIGTALVNGLVVGAKLPVSIIPYCVIGFECTILFGTLFNFTGTLVHTRLGRPNVPACYDRRFSRDRFGLFVACPAEQTPLAKSLLSSTSAEEVHVV
jgi:molybdopterin-containing oxidoreductase family membrane subunit